MNTAEAVAKFVAESPEFMMIDTDDTGDGWTIISEEELEELLTRASAAGLEPDDMGKETPDYSVGCWEASWIWISNNKTQKEETQVQNPNLLYEEEKRFVIDRTSSIDETGIIVKTRLVRCEIDGKQRLHRRTQAERYSGDRYDPYITDTLFDSEKLFDVGTPESVAIRETIKFFDGNCNDIAAESNTYINGFTEKPEDYEIPY